MIQSYLHHLRELPRNVKFFLMGHAVQACGHAVYALLFNLYLREAGFREGTMGALASTTSLGTALMAFPAAFVLERFAVKPLMLAGMSLSALFYFLQVQSSGVDAFIFFGLLGAMSLALFNISVSPFIFRNVSHEQRVYAFTMNSSVIMTAQLMGFLIGGELPKTLGSWLPGMSALESYKWAMAGALIFTWLAFIPYLQILRVKVPRLRKPLLGELREKEWRTLSRLIAPKICIALGAGMIIPFMNIYLSSRFGLNSQSVGACFGTLQLCMIIGVSLSPLFVKRMDRLPFILSTALLSVPFMLAMAFTSSVALVLGSFFMRGMLMNMSTPVTSLFEMERVREQDCLFASSLLIFCYNVAWTFSTQAGGWVIEHHGFKASFICASFFYVAGVGCYWRFFHRKKPVEPAKTEPLREAA